ncbi:Low-density lipoprotein receptor- protein 1B [Homalodisca vitripennis]|nr:Low-density lipoprotein receptor- protein 1B [Homalodisca vitripennis]
MADALHVFIGHFGTARLMYWSDWASGSSPNGKIEFAWMNGEQRKVFVDSGLQWPNGLTIDYFNRKLYWCDAYLDKIERISLDGSERKVVFHGSDLDHPYGLAYYEKLLFWTEFQKGTVQCLNLENDTVTTLSTENAPLFEIRVFDNSTQTVRAFKDGWINVQDELQSATVFWDRHGILLFEFVEQGRTIDGAAYCYTLTKIQYLEYRISHPDPTLPSKPKIPSDYLVGNRSTTRWWLVPSNFHLYGYLKEFLCGKRFNTDDEIKKQLKIGYPHWQQTSSTSAFISS